MGTWNDENENGMKLCDIFSQEYVLVESESNIRDIDTTYEDDLFCVEEVESTTLRKLLEDEELSYVADEIIRGGAEGEDDGIIHVYEGTVTGITGIEPCIIYAPEYWQ